MPISVPVLDDRSFDQLVAEAKARVPVHTPEWTNLNDSDPGITIVQLFAFLTENLLYRSNRIPEANRLKFLSMLGITLQPASPGVGLVTFQNDRGPLVRFPLPAGTEVRAGQVPFVTRTPLDVLAVTGAVYYKKPQTNLDPTTLSRYQLLYQTFLQTSADVLAPQGVDRDQVRRAIADQTLTIGVYPAATTPGQVLLPASTGGPQVDPGVVFEIAAPQPDPTGLVGPGFGIGPPNYSRLPMTYADAVLQAPGVVQVTLPPYDKLLLWAFDPEEEGTEDFPPRVDDAAVTARLITWIRLRYPPLPATAVTPSGSSVPSPAPGSALQPEPQPEAPTGPCGCSSLQGFTQTPTTLALAAAAANAQPSGRITWVGLNAARVVQAVTVANELLGTGTGTPFQTFAVAHKPVIVDQPGASFTLEVTDPRGNWQRWPRIDDIYAAGPDDTVYTLDAESGQVTGGGGLFGARFPLGASIRVTYEYGGGPEGQVPIGGISNSVALPGGYSVSNPVATWGAAAGETVSDGEANITRWLRHRDRLVTAVDFRDITRRTPGVDVGRVEVLPLFNPLYPDISQSWPGMVTVLVIPRSDARTPTAPAPDRQFLNSVCAWLDPRRLVTTEVHVRGPVYLPIWVSVGIEVLPGQLPSFVQQAVNAAVTAFLSPLTGGLPNPDDTTALLGAATSGGPSGTGWPLGVAVRSQDIEAVATRVAGVRYVDSVRIAAAPGGVFVASLDPVGLVGLQLPAATVFVNHGPAEDPAALVASSQPAPPTQVPVPVVPPTC